MATDSFTSTAATVASSSGAIVFVVAESEYNRAGFYVKIDPTGVSVTKASTFGGSQGALTFPITRQEALSLARSLLNIAT